MKTRREFIKISTVGAGAAALGLNAFGAGMFKWFESKAIDAGQ